MRTINFRVKEINGHHIILEEYDEKKSFIMPLWRKYGKIVQSLMVLLSALLFTIGISMAISKAYNNSNITKNVIGEVILEGNGEFHFDDNLFPITEEDALALFYPDYFKSTNNLDPKGEYKAKNITIRNTGPETIIYNIVMEELSVSNIDRLNPNIIRYRSTDITNSNIKESTKYVSNFLSNNKFNGKIYDTSNPNGYTPDNYYVLSSGKLEPGFIANYSIIVWIDYSQTINSDQNKLFDGRVKVVFEPEK